MSQFLLLPPPPPPPPSLPKSLPKEAETESDDDDDSIGSIPLPYGPPPRPMDLNGCFNAEFSTPKSHRNRNPIINKEQFTKEEEDDDQDYRNHESIQQLEENCLEKFEDHQNNGPSSKQLNSNNCPKTEFSTPESTSRNEDSIDEKSKLPDMYYPNRNGSFSFSMEKRKFKGNRNTHMDQEMFTKSFPRRQFHNRNRDQDQQYHQNRHDSPHSSPHFFQRRSWHGNRSYKNEPEPTYSSDRYKNGWLFVDQDKYQREYYEKLFIESEKFNTERPSFKIAPIIFMFDLTPMVPFFTNKFCFSNHFMCDRLKIDDRHFCCTEQFYMFYKARVFGDRRAMSEIMSTNDPKAMKRIGATVYGYEQSKWDKISIQVMVIASIKKYEQNPALRRQLFETSGAELVETNPMDNRWGIGLSMADWRIRDKEEWRGQNWLGRLLTMLREKLLEREEFADEREEMLREIQETMEAANSVGCLKVEVGQLPKTEEEQFANETNATMDNFII